MSTDADRVFEFLSELDRVKIHYDLGRHREDSIMVKVAVPGERWEVEFFRNGDVEVEVFRSDEALRDEAALDELFQLPF